MWRNPLCHHHDPPPLPTTLRLLVGCAAGFGTVALALAVADLAGGLGAPPATPAWPGLAAFTLMVAGSGYVTVRVRIRSTWHGVSWTDAVVLVGLATLPVSWVVVCTAAGVLLARVLERRAVIKVVFAVTKEPTVAAAGGLALLAAGGPGDITSPSGIALLVLAFVVMSAVDQLLTIPVVAVDSGSTVRERFRANGDIWVIALAGRLLVALLAVLVLRHQHQLVYALPLLVLLGHVWHEQWVRTREERRAWQAFAAVTETFATADLNSMLRRAVTGGAHLFSAEVLEVELNLTGPRRLVRGGPEAILYDGDPADAPPDPRRPHGTQLSLHAGPGQPEVGVVRLRFRTPVRLSEREQAMLASYATALETAIRHACKPPAPGGEGRLRAGPPR